MIRIIVLLIAFPIHETAHALSAHWMGDDTAKEQGRITLNPFKHLTLVGTLFMIFAGFGWAKPVPINPTKFKNPKRGMALSSAAGPLSNLILAYISMIIWKIFIYLDLFSINGIASDFLIYCAFLNVMLAVFNLLPIPPLDGSRLFTLFLPHDKYFKLMKYEKYIMIALFAVIWLGLLDGALVALQSAAIAGLDFLSEWVDILMESILY